MSEGSEGDGLLGFLEYVRRPPGDGHTLITAAGAWERAANGIRESLDRLDREVARVVGPHWDARDARLLLGRWEDLRRNGREAEQHLRGIAHELSSLGRSIEDAQHQWDMAMASAAVAIGVGIGLGFLTFGLADAAAATAASQAATLTAGVAAWLEGIVQGSGVIFLQLAESTAAISARLLVNFSVNVASQSLSGVVTSPDHSLLHINPEEAIVFAGVDTYIGPSVRTALPTKTPGWAVEAATSMTSDTAAQLTGPEHDVNPLEVVLSGGVGAGSSRLLERAGGRLRAPDRATLESRALRRRDGRASAAKITAARARVSNVEVPRGELGDELLGGLAAVLGEEPSPLSPTKMPGGGLQGASGDEIWYIHGDGDEPAAVVKVFRRSGKFLRELSSMERFSREPFEEVHLMKPLLAEGVARGGNRDGGAIAMTVAPGRTLDARLRELGEAGPGRQGALRRVEEAVRSNGSAFAELHTRPRGSGGRVAHAYIEQAVRHLDDTVASLAGLEPFLGALVDLGSVRKRVSELAAGYRANPGPAGFAHGDAHPGNVFYDEELGTALVDLPNAHFSIDHRGRPIGSPARDVASYLQNLASIRKEARLRPEEVERLQQDFMRYYQDGGGADLTEEALAFYRADTALSDLRRAATHVQQARAARNWSASSEDGHKLRGRLLEMVDLAKEALDLDE